MEYRDLKESELFALFATENWNKLDSTERLGACQEVENRYAAANNTVPLRLVPEEMMNKCYGYQSGKKIAINSYLLEQGVFQVELKDNNGKLFGVEEVDVDAPGWNVLDTIFHEGTHGIQEQQNRTVRNNAYFVPEADYYLYRIQPIEKEAYEQGQINTLLAIDKVITEQNILEPDMKLYSDSVKADSYDKSLQRAMYYYADPKIEQNMAQVVEDRNRRAYNPNPSREYRQLERVLDTGKSQRVNHSISRSEPEVKNNQNVTLLRR